MKSKCLVIAEAGVNHNGDLNLAKKLVDAAVNAGADIVKFQTFRAEELVTPDAGMADYQKENLGKDDSQYSMLKKLELSHENHRVLIKYCKEKGIEFLSTGFDENSIQFLNDLGLKIFKIPSGELTNYPYLKKIASFKPEEIILSTGMATMDEVCETVNILESFGVSREKLIVLHCTTDYPTELQDVNLRAMLEIQVKTGCRIGYSDHTTSLEVPVVAHALGAVVIEKHFTLDKFLEGPDHKASLEPNELKEMVKNIRDVEIYLGKAIKAPTCAEVKNRLVVRKSVVAGREIKKGEVLSEKNLTTKRPGSGVSPMKWLDILGQTAKRDFKKDEMIEI